MARCGPSSTLAALLWVPNAIGKLLDLKTGAIVWAIKCIRGNLFSTKFRIFTDHRSVQQLDGNEEHNP